jgi:teichuronic acid biosynthesis glycosyltransferase TuaG
MTKFTVVMPVYNTENYISQAIQSVLDQTYQNWELILINDGSRDNSVKKIKPYLIDKRLSIINCKKNLGVANARNLGIHKAKGEIICFLDSDDWWAPRKLELQKQLFDRGIKFVYSSFNRVLPNGKVNFVRVKAEITPTSFYFYNPIPNLTGAFHRSLLPILQKKIKHEDYLMWFQIINKSKTAKSTDSSIPLAFYRVGNQSISSNKFKSAQWHWNILKNHFHLNLMTSIFFSICYILRSLYIRVKEIFL